jgi:hypothetical protein
VSVRTTDIKRFIGQLEHDPALLPVLMETAKKAKTAAEQAAPRDSGHYAKSFVIEVEKGKVVLGNTDIAAHLIEWGSAKNRPYAPLRRAVHALGIRLSDE